MHFVQTFVKYTTVLYCVLCTRIIYYGSLLFTFYVYCLCNLLYILWIMDKKCIWTKEQMTIKTASYEIINKMYTKIYIIYTF